MVLGKRTTTLFQHEGRFVTLTEAVKNIGADLKALAIKKVAQPAIENFADH